MREFQSFTFDWWSASVPSSWSVEQRRERVMMHPTRSASVSLEIRCIRKQEGVYTEGDVERFAEGVVEGGELHCVSVNGSQGFQVSKYVDGVPKKIWYWVDGVTLFAATLFAKAGDVEGYEPEAFEILKMIREV